MHLFGALVHEPVVEALVVAVVEALLLERLLQVPVGLGDEDEVGVAALDGRDHRRPVVVGGRAPPRSPQVRSKTSFIISIAMSQRTPSHWSAMEPSVSTTAARSSGEKAFELHDVGPRREVRVAAVGEHPAADLHERRRVALRGRRRCPATKCSGMRRRPRVVGRDVVRHEVEDQLRGRAARARSRAAASPPGRRGARRPCSRGRSTASRPRPRS